MGILQSPGKPKKTSWDYSWGNSWRGSFANGDNSLWLKEIFKLETFIFSKMKAQQIIDDCDKRFDYEEFQKEIKLLINAL